MYPSSNEQTRAPRDLYLQAVAGLDAVIAAVGTCDRDLATPCGEWSIGDLLGHVVTEQLWASQLLAGHTLEEASERIEAGADDPLDANASAAFRAASRDAEAALGSCPDARPVHTSAGVVPAAQFMTELFADLLVHTWDLAQALGKDYTFSPSAVDACIGWFTHVEDNWRRAGRIGARPALAADADAQTTLLAMFGRRAAYAPAFTVNGLPDLTPELTSTTVDELGTVLGVWAHPDDEAYLSAALMALAAGNGQRVVCVTATKGERGSPDPDRWPPHRLAAMREREMRASLAALGVAEHRWLPHRDGEVALVPFERGARSIYEIICEVAPDTILTFGPEGMTGHPDHRTVGNWTTAAWRRSLANKPSRLQQATKPDGWADAHHVVNERFNVFGAAGPPRAAHNDLALRVNPSPAVLDAKMAALRAQSSQTGALLEAMGETEYRRWSAEEYFVSAPMPSETQRVERASASPRASNAP